MIPVVDNKQQEPKTRPTVVNPEKVPEFVDNIPKGNIEPLGLDLPAWISPLDPPSLPIGDCVVLYKGAYYFSPDISRIDCAAFSAEVEAELERLDNYRRSRLLSLLPLYEWSSIDKSYHQLCDGAKEFRDHIPEKFRDRLYVNINTYEAIVVYLSLDSRVRIWRSPGNDSHHAVLDLSFLDDLYLLHTVKKDGITYLSRPSLVTYEDAGALVADIPGAWFDSTNPFALAERGLELLLAKKEVAKEVVKEEVNTVVAPVTTLPVAHIPLELPEWTQHFDYISVDRVPVVYTAKRKSTWHECFKYARYRFMSMIADEGKLCYRGPSKPFVSKRFDVVEDGPKFTEFGLSSSKKDYSVLLVLPTRPGRYELFDKEGYAVRETDRSISIYLRGSKDVLIQPYVPVDVFRPVAPCMGGSFRPIDHVRVGADAFLCLYYYTPRPAIRSTDPALLDSIGVEYGTYVDTMFYQEDLRVMQQWTASGLNGEKFVKDMLGCLKPIACYFSAIYGTSIVLRDGAEQPTFIQLCRYIHRKYQYKDRDTALECVALRDPYSFTDQIVSGVAFHRTERILMKNERLNAKSVMPSNIFKRIKSCYNEWVGDSCLKTAIRAPGHVLSQQYDPIKFFQDHFKPTPILRGLPEYMAKKALKNPDVYDEYSARVMDANALKQHRSDYFLMAGAKRPEAVLVDLTVEQKAQVANPLPYPIQGQFTIDKPLLNPVQYQDIDPYYFPMVPARAPQHKLEGLEWALSIRQLRPLAVPELNNPVWTEFQTYMQELNMPPVEVPLLTFEEYLEGVESTKRDSYRKGWNKFLETGKCPISYNLLAKPYENQYKPVENENKLKTRLIFNPSYEMKAFGGYLSKLLALVFKRWFPEMCLHQTPGGLKRRIIRQLHRFQNARFMMWDGARHDAHQSRNLIELTDIPLQLKALELVGPANGFNPHMMEVARTIIRQVHAFFMVKARTPGNRDRNIDPLCVRGTIDGTVFSGHPLRTTLGNSSRITLVVRFIAARASVPFYRGNQSGDDTMNIFEDSDILPFYESFRQVYGEEGKRSPLGLVYSDFSISDSVLDFLGKEGRIYGKGALMDLERPIGKIHTFAWYYEVMKYRDGVGQGIADYVKRNYERLEYLDILVRYPKSSRPIELKWCQYEFDAEEKLAEIPVVTEHTPFIPLAGCPSQSNLGKRSEIPMVKRVVQTSNKGSIPVKQVKKLVKKEVKKDVQQVKKPKSGLRRGLEGLAKFAGGRFGFADEAQWLASTGLDYLGVGAYKFADGTVQGTPPPTRIRKIEFVKNVSSTTSFTTSSNLINPTNANLFPWLSQIATSFQRYRFNSLVFHYKTTCGSAISSTNNALGVVGMVANYDPDAAAFATKQAAEATGKCRTSVPSASFYWGMECKKTMRTYPWFFTFTTASATKDTKLLYPAKFNLFTDGMQAANVTLGELWVEYDITLIDTIQTIPGVASSSDIYTFAGATAVTHPGAASLVAGDLSTSYTASSGVLSLPAGVSSGYYQLNWYNNFTAATNWDPTISLSSNLSIANVGPSSVAATIAPATGVSAADKMLTVCVFKKDNLAATITLTFSGSVSTNNGWASLAAIYVPVLTLTNAEQQEYELGLLFAKYANVFQEKIRSLESRLEEFEADDASDYVPSETGSYAEVQPSYSNCGPHCRH